MPSPRFECDRCGLCCRLIGNVPQLKHFDRGDGVCVHLTCDNLCDIYDHRPEVCSVDRMYSRFAAKLSKDEYLDAMSTSCTMLKSHFDELRSAMSGVEVGEGEKAGLETDFERLMSSLPEGSLDSLSEEVLGTSGETGGEG